MTYMTFTIDNIESLVNLDEYCIFQKSYDCTKNPTIIFHAKHDKDFMVSFSTERQRDDTYDLIKSELDVNPLSHLEIWCNGLTFIKETL